MPVSWVFMASIKQNAEFYGNPWALPAGFYWQNSVSYTHLAAHQPDQQYLQQVLTNGLAAV